MDFPINAMSEGRILVPYELRIPSNETDQLNNSASSMPHSCGGVTNLQTDAILDIFSADRYPDWHGEGNVWEAYRKTCAPGTAARRLFSSYRASSTSQTSLLTAPNDEFSFDNGIAGAYSFCKNPWAHYNQGHFFSDWRTISALFPMFSPAKAAGYSDIRIPSHYYYAQVRRYTYGWDPVNLQLTDVDGMETAWEDKSDKIFWRGASTGGGSSPPGFAAQYQRHRCHPFRLSVHTSRLPLFHGHRFVRLASDQSTTNRTVVFADPPGSTNYVYADVPAATLNDEIMDVAFLKVVGAENFPGGINELVRTHRIDDTGTTLGDHWKYKYVVDLDGMSYSGRFFSFLESDSAVLKATVYREFFSDWIQPWYVISSTLRPPRSHSIHC